MHETEEYKADILVVDDQIINLKFLTATLTNYGYRVRPAISGELALETVRKVPPDLILLDIMMPKMDGYMVCQELKTRPETKDIPVIFISALDKAKDKVKAFSAGAVDYITKPFEVNEVVARVQTHLALRRMQKQLEKKNIQLEQEITERKRVEGKLKSYQDHLEELVEARTAELMKANENLHREIAERQKTETALQESGQFLQSTLDALSAHIAILDDQGLICAVNQSWRKFGQENGLGWDDAGVGRNYLEVIDTASDDADVAQIGEKLRQVLQQQCQQFSATYECHSGQEKRWFSMHVSRFAGNGGVQIVVSHDNVTEQKLAEETVRSRESMLRTIINATQDAIIAIDKYGLITLYNPGAEKIFGFNQAEMMGQPLNKIIPGDYRGAHHDYIKSYFLTGEPSRVVGQVVELPALRSDGEKFPMEVSLAAGMHDAEKFVVAVVRDITRRKRAEEERLKREQFLSLLNDVTRVTLENSDLSTILNVLVNEIGELYGADSVYLTLWDEDEETAKTAAVYGDPQYLIMEAEPGEASLTRAVLQARRPLVAKNVKHTPFISPRLAAILPDWSLLGLPLIAGDQKMGAILVGFRTFYSFSSDDIARGEQIARQIALAVAKTQLLEEIQVRWYEAETLRKATAAITQSLSMDERMEVILEQLDQVVPYDSASVQLLRDNSLEIVGGRGFPNSEAVIGLRFPVEGDNVNSIVVREHKPIVLSDVREEYAYCFTNPHEHVNSWLGVPLIVQDRLIGMLTVDSTEYDHFNLEHVRLVIPFANQVAAALENAQLYEKARQDAKIKATLLSEVNHRVKNNLSAIIGLLYAERRHAGLKDDAIYQSIMNGLINRIRGLAIVHNLLSASEWLPLRLSVMTEQLITTAFQLLPRHKQAEVTVTPSPVEVTSKQANNLALVINELATNTVKHALQERDVVKIDVAVSAEGDEISLIYRDDGPGYPENVLQMDERNLGLYLIQTLVRSGMRGKCDLHNENGAVAVIRFASESKNGMTNERTIPD
jgi:PAS domain S-box-containing protein